MARCCLLVLICCAASPSSPARADYERPVIVASKSFTEAVIVGEVLTILLNAEGIEARHKAALGGRPLVWNALLSGSVDVYGDYTGTIVRETLAPLKLPDNTDLAPILAGMGIGISKSLGFNNTYTIGMRRDRAKTRGIGKISDLASHRDLVIGLDAEFIEREDGWPSLVRHYGLRPKKVIGMEHDISYKALVSGNVDAINLYSTDAEINSYDIRVLTDDKHLFTDYQAVFLYRLETAHQVPGLLSTIQQLEGQIDEAQMVAMNASSRVHGTSENAVASRFLHDQGLIEEYPTEDISWLRQHLKRMAEAVIPHFVLVFLPLALNISTAIPLGILAAHRPSIGRLILGFASILQTLPTLALLVLFIPILGIGYPPALLALYIYGLLPILKNTYLGIESVPANLKETAEALGLSWRRQLFYLELPLAAPMILAGVKMAAVINVGTATIGAIIGAGGFGQIILAGIRHDDWRLVLEGAIPSGLMALGIQWLFSAIELGLTPRGLRIKASS